MSTLALEIPLELRLSRAPVSQRMRETVIPGGIPAAATALFLWALRTVRMPDAAVDLVLFCLAGGLLYGLVILRYCLRKEDRRDLARALDKMQRKLIPGLSLK
jgi:hypothetical protein